MRWSAARTRATSRAVCVVAALVAPSCGARPVAEPRFVVSGTEACEAGSTTLPLAFHDGLAETEVVIGARSVPLVLDTGAFAAIALAPTVLATLDGVRFTGAARRFTDARGHRLVAREFAIPEIRLGTLRVAHVVGQELAFAPDFAPPNRVGYIGRGLFRRSRLLLDYGARTATLMAGGPCASETEMHRRRAVPVEIGADGIVVDAALDGARVRLVLDTGATHSLLRPGAAPRGTSAQQRIARRLTIGDETLDGFAFVLVDAGPPGTDGMLGENFLAAHRVLIDFPARRLWIAPAAPAR